MKKYFGIRFSLYGQVRIGFCEHHEEHNYTFGQGVVAHTEHGLSFGRIVWLNLLADNKKVLSANNAQADGVNPEKNANIKKHKKSNGDGAGKEDFVDTQETCYPPVGIRPASIDELLSAESNDILSREAYLFCKRCIHERELDMKLVNVEVLLDKSKMIFYFTAPTRIDFRELVKDLVREYRTRIELRQIGVRHETQILGALGNCGMVVCCRRFLEEFAPVTIKMAKEQNLFLNSSKISGICGRLLCCLSYEQENYDVFHKASPRLGKRYQTTRGIMRVLRSNMFRNAVIVINEEHNEEEICLDVWATLNPTRLESNQGQGDKQVNDRNTSPVCNGQESDASLKRAEDTPSKNRPHRPKK